LSAVGKDPSNTATILVYGQKDAARLETGKGFLHDLPKDMNELVPTANERGYVYVAPIMQGGMSASDFRKVMASEVDKQEKVKAFNQFFGKFDENIFAFIEDRLK
jgi:hypothetical protein